MVSIVHMSTPKDFLPQKNCVEMVHFEYSPALPLQITNIFLSLLLGFWNPMTPNVMGQVYTEGLKQICWLHFQRQT